MQVQQEGMSLRVLVLGDSKMRDFLGRPHWILVFFTLLVAAGVLGCPPANDDDGKVTVPNVVGMTLEEAKSALEELGLGLSGVTEGYSRTVPAGMIRSQSPVAGTRVIEGRSVSLVVSLGPEPGGVTVEVGDFSINNGASSTTSRTVTLNNACTGGPTQYMASESSSFSGASWKTYSTAPSFTLSSGNGTKTVYFKVKNAGGESSAKSDTISLNEGGSAPKVSSFSINNGDSSTTSRTVTLNNTCTGSPTQYMASESSGFSGASWKAYSTAPSFTLSSGNGTKTVYFKVKNAGGESSAKSDTISLNEGGSAPKVSSFSINNGDSSTTSRTVTLNNTCTGSPTQYMASESSGFSGASWKAYSTAPSFTLSSGNGTKTVYFKVKNASGESNSASDTISLNEGSGTETIMLPGNVPLVMVWIPGGTFMMGRYSGEQDSWDYEDPQHSVTVPGFWMGKYEVTQAQWEAVMGSNPSGFSGANRPVEEVSWNDVKSFIAALNSYTGKTFRLPSEAEWEYACRAGTTTRFYWGDDASYTQIGDYAWYSDNSGNETYDAGGKLANAFGLYDMSGNVWEWCEDDYHSSYTGAPTNGGAWVDSPSGSHRVSRGGGWSSMSDYCRSAGRSGTYPSYTHCDLGFRLSRGTGEAVEPDLTVSPASVSLSQSAPSTTVTVSNAGGGTLSWTATSNDAAVTVTPSTFTGNSTVVTIATDDFSEPYTAHVTFTNNADAANSEVVTVHVNEAPGAPAVSSFSINNGASSTTSRTVTLNNTCAGSPTQYMAGESSSFSGASWQAYSTAPSFTLSSGNGTKTVYFKVKSSAGDSKTVTDTIVLNESQEEPEVHLDGDTVSLPGAQIVLHGQVSSDIATGVGVDDLVGILHEGRGYLYHSALGDAPISDTTSRRAVGWWLYYQYLDEAKDLPGEVLLGTGVVVSQTGASEYTFTNTKKRWAAVVSEAEPRAVFLQPRGALIDIDIIGAMSGYDPLVTFLYEDSRAVAVDERPVATHGALVRHPLFPFIIGTANPSKDVQEGVLNQWLALKASVEEALQADPETFARVNVVDEVMLIIDGVESLSGLAPGECIDGIIDSLLLDTTRAVFLSAMAEGDDVAVDAWQDLCKGFGQNMIQCAAAEGSGIGALVSIFVDIVAACNWIIDDYIIGAIDAATTLAYDDVNGVEPPSSPTVSSFSINNGASSTTSQTVTLNNACTGSPAQYMASESSSFSGASWQTYATAPSFTLSSGNGTKTVYFKVKNTSGESNSASDAISLNEGSGTETIMLPDNVPLEMVWIPADTFQMGRYPGEQDSYSDEAPQHQVTLSQGFWMGKYEVTQAQWEAVMGSNPSYFSGANRPVEKVSWNNVQSFITALNSLTGETFRLPTEAEWEYACRGGTTTRFYWGDDPTYTQIGNYAWYGSNSGSQTHDVGAKLPNGFDLYDMSGNVWEWCQDWYGAYPSGSVTDPTGPASGSYRVRRGGSWYGYGYYCRSAVRVDFNPSYADGGIGFRLSR